ncbi:MULTISPECIES: ferredoxin [Rhodococcus]|uniref:Ferredoxin n=1 Tax=Rhodococcus pseudokoreensis TaxID=2811421 RepID=A0A974W0M7_9NOCA|nr:MULTISPECIES: ferredoxin [Rhodococcus]MBV6757407.1 ferredoxin [Rhodococcus opacus]QSE88188.1 ferredoxin [Rhodococcus pseudokoreensis]
MKLAVDLNQCENHGQCTFATPSLFSLTDEGLLSFRSTAQDEYVSADLTEADAEAAAAAVDMCPMQAISLRG